MLTGTSIDGFIERLADVQSTRAAFTALAFIALGLFLKMALFPLHFWLVRTPMRPLQFLLMAATASLGLCAYPFGVRRNSVLFPGLADAVGLLVLTWAAGLYRHAGCHFGNRFEKTLCAIFHCPAWLYGHWHWCWRRRRLCPPLFICSITL